MGLSFSQRRHCHLVYYHKDKIKDSVSVQEYLAYINKSIQNVHYITVPISANSENELHEYSRSANLKL